MSFDEVLERVLREDGWDVSPGPVDGSLLAEGDGERVLLTWTGDETGPAADRGSSDTLTAQADARPAEDPEPNGASATETTGPVADDDGAEFLDATPDQPAGETPSSSEPSQEPSPEPTPEPAREASSGSGGASDGDGAEFIDATVDEVPDEAGADTGRGGEEPLETEGPSPEVATAGDPTSADDAEPRGRPAGEVGEVPVVRLRVDREEAEDEARPKMVDVKETTLELVPHLAFEYTCRVPDGTGDVETYRGNIVLNAITESAMTLEAPRFADGVPQGARLLEPEMDRAEAIPEAQAHLEERFTRDVKVEEGDGNVSMMETKRVSPDEDGIDLDAQGTWYVPVWRIDGENGSMRIDANRGEVLDERLYEPTGTDAEWM